jgi:hypothetical protein
MRTDAGWLVVVLDMVVGTFHNGDDAMDAYERCHDTWLACDPEGSVTVMFGRTTGRDASY